MTNPIAHTGREGPSESRRRCRWPWLAPVEVVAVVVGVVVMVFLVGSRETRAAAGGEARSRSAGAIPAAMSPRTDAATPASPAPGLPPARSPTPLAPPAGNLTSPTSSPSSTPPVSAAAALERIRAAYEYGDIDEVVEWSRQVTEGRLHPTPPERAYALRYLGIGLFLTGRAEGAETAFFELLRLRSDTRLDPKTTRPDAVAFFEQVRQRHAQEIQVAARASNPKLFLWSFFPPLGQFQNGHRSRGITLGALELVSLGTAITTYAILTHWSRPDDTFPDRYADARALKLVNYVAVGVLVATYVFGVIDGIAHYSDAPPEDTTPPARPTTSLSLTPSGLTLRF